ncbi:hypothetical protein HRI_004669200 [Hibiscus trionum]|uniref:Uncharacterized protein n=1 Tax=Hibiscus trionum TaxID=183268 RepID=A0A9W7MSQ7_HIBTR|nr:hypothetical protein HRI_004669200 [Hibiscus trionum]
MNHWDSICSSIAWSVGNGLTLRLLDDVWLPSLGPLRHHTLIQAAELADVSISNLVDENGGWNIDLLASIFPSNVVSHILSTKCPEPSDQGDACVWRWSSNHTFYIKSAHNLLSESTWDSSFPIWKMI